MQTTTLRSLIRNDRTDKDTSHSYLDTYEGLFAPKRYSAKRVLEIGIGSNLESNGGSIKLWYDYFPNADVYGIDNIDISNVWPEIVGLKDDNHKVVLHTGVDVDAYDYEWFKTNIAEMHHQKFDIIIDDGPHSIGSFLKCLQFYSTVLAEDGILVMEDIPNDFYTQVITSACPYHLVPYMTIVDLRHVKNQFDDVLCVIDCSSRERCT